MLRSHLVQYLIQNTLTDDLGKEQFFKGFDASCYYEGYYELKSETLSLFLGLPLND